MKTLRGKWYIVNKDTYTWGYEKFCKNVLVKVTSSYKHFHVVETIEGKTLLFYKQDLTPYLEVKAVSE